MKRACLPYCLCVLFLASGCYTFSGFQTARLLSRGRYEVTPSYSSVSLSNEGASQSMTDNWGVQVGYGLTDQANLRFRYERLESAFDGSKGYNYLALGPKFGLIKDRAACGFPVGLYWGADLDTPDTWHIQPTLCLTKGLGSTVEITVAPSYLMFLKEGADDWVALNVGLGFSSDLTKWAVRPEIGFLKNPGEEGHYSSWGLAISVIR